VARKRSKKLRRQDQEVQPIRPDSLGPSRKPACVECLGLDELDSVPRWNFCVAGLQTRIPINRAVERAESSATRKPGSSPLAMTSLRTGSRFTKAR
jgi:hypothetical protein